MAPDRQEASRMLEQQTPYAVREWEKTINSKIMQTLVGATLVLNETICCGSANKMWAIKSVRESFFLHGRYQARRPSVVAKYYQAWWTKRAAIKFNCLHAWIIFSALFSRTVTLPRELLELIYLHMLIFILSFSTLSLVTLLHELLSLSVSGQRSPSRQAEEKKSVT